MEENVKRRKRTLSKIIATAVFFGMISPAAGVLGETKDDLKKENYIEKKEDIIKNIDEMCESIRADLEANNDAADQEAERAEELIEYVRNTYGDNVGDKMSDVEINAARLDVNEKFGIDEPVIVSYRKGFTIKILFFNMWHEDGTRIQIWGKNNKNYFLVKDYGMKIEDKMFYSIYEWDITESTIDGRAIDVGNISDKNESELEKLYDTELDNVGIYITSRPEMECEEPITYFKNFSLIERDIFRGVNMVTSYDDEKILERDSFEVTMTYLDGMNINQSSQFPAVAVKMKNFDIALFKERGEDFNNYKVTIEGWNEGEKYNVPLKVKSDGTNKATYRWIPKYDGVFNIVVDKMMCGKWVPVIVRKVFVKRQANTGYLGVEDMIVTDENGNMTVKVDTENFKDNVKNKSRIALRVGEESVWSKTLKNYESTLYKKTSEGSEGKEKKHTITMSEEYNNFRMNKGKYFVDALVKKEYSSDYEDIARRNFTRDKAGFGELFKIESPLNDQAPVMRSEYSFNMVPTEKLAGTGLSAGDLEYAMLIWDARGKRIIKAYNSSAEFNYTFMDPGKYKIYLRARIPGGYREEEGVKYLGNSYLEEQIISVDIPMEEGEEVQINSVTLESFKHKSSSNSKDVTFQKNNIEVVPVNSDYAYAGKALKFHSKNRIVIDAVKKNKEGEKLRETRLMYKVYAIHDGIWECLTPYTTSKIITFYPRSEGKYKLLVLVKDSVSGSEEDSVIIELEADNNY